MKNKIQGGLSDGLSLVDIVNKHEEVLNNLGFKTRTEKLEKIKHELSLGLKVEMEHTDESSIAREIALDHLYESPIYYTELNKMEKKTEKMINESKRFKELLGLSEAENKKSLMSEEFSDKSIVGEKKTVLKEDFNRDNFDVYEFDVDDFGASEVDELYNLNESVILEFDDEEDSYEIEDEDTSSSELFSETLIEPVLKVSGLSYLIDESPESLVFDILEALYVYTHDYNDDTSEIHGLRSLMKKYDFKPSPMLSDVDDLSDEGKLIYDAFIQVYEEAGDDEYNQAMFGSKDSEVEPRGTN